MGLACEGWSQAAAFLLPWCCVLAFRHVLATLEAVTASLGLDYQLKAGSALGAVKLGNFIPWDIDIDVDFPSEHLHHFRPGGRAHQQLTEAGLQLYSFRRDMYSVAGAGMFLMQHGKSSFHTPVCSEENICLRSRPGDPDVVVCRNIENRGFMNDQVIKCQVTE